MSTVGRRLLSAVVEQGNVKEFLKMQLAPDLFRDSELELYQYITNHLAKYGKIPKPETIAGTSGFESALVLAPEPPEFYLHEVEQRYLNTTLKDMVSEAIDMLKEKKGEETLKLVTDAVGQMFHFKHRQHLFDLRHMKDLVGKEYLKTKTSIDGGGLMFGWPTIDNMTGGMREGDFVTFVGRPAAGKTFKVLRVAKKAWLSGEVPLFISTEMNITILAQRIAAMYTHSPLTKLLKAEMTTPSFKKMMEGLVQVQHMDNEFWVVDGNFATTVQDIVMLCHQLKPSCAFVDGAYLLKHPNPRINKFERIADNAEWLKEQVATDIGIPCVASYQLNREVLKKKKTEKVGVEDIYGSDAIGQLSTVCMGLFQEEGVETMHRRVVNILKGRNGEVGEFTINWEFEKMNFDEVVPEEDQHELGFIN